MRLRKYKNLAPKLLQVLEKRGKRHEDIAILCGVRRTTVTMWLRKDAPTSPRDEHLVNIARLMGDEAWWYLAWFLDDEVAFDRGVDYDNQGRRSALEPEWDLEEAEAMSAAWSAEHDRTNSPPKSGPLAEALRASEAADLDPVRQALGGRETPDSGRAQESVRAPYESVMPRTERSERGSTRENEGGLAALSRYLIHQEDRAWELSSKPFVESAIAKLISRHPEALHGVEKMVERSNLRLFPKYFDGQCLIEIATTRLRFKTEAIVAGLGKLFLIEKMLGRTTGKFLALCVDLRDARENPRLQADVDMAKNLGVTLAFYSPEEDSALALAMEAFILGHSLEVQEARNLVRKAISGARATMELADSENQAVDLDRLIYDITQAQGQIDKALVAIKKNNINEPEQSELCAKLDHYRARLQLKVAETDTRRMFSNKSKDRARPPKR